MLNQIWDFLYIKSLPRNRQPIFHIFSFLLKCSSRGILGWPVQSSMRSVGYCLECATGFFSWLCVCYCPLCFSLAITWRAQRWSVSCVLLFHSFPYRSFFTSSWIPTILASITENIVGEFIASGCDAFKSCQNNLKLLFSAVWTTLQVGIT